MKLFISRYIVADIPPNLLPKKYVSGLIMAVAILPIIRTDVNRINEMIRILLFVIKIEDSGEKSPEYVFYLLFIDTTKSYPYLYLYLIFYVTRPNHYSHYIFIFNY